MIETEKGVVRLLPIAERAKQLFGEGRRPLPRGSSRTWRSAPTRSRGCYFRTCSPALLRRSEGEAGSTAHEAEVDVSDESLAAGREATTLDRVHAAMLLQAGGRTNALRALLKAEQERGSDFLRLANAFSALYPKGSEEKRLIDAMLLAVPR